MSFQTPLTIKDVLIHLERRDYVLPAIQREFVWSQDQIIQLLDSLMRGYPVGSFLFWKVEPERSRDFRFYDFVLNYHQRTAPHCPPHDLTTRRELTAILDGQQRLTSLNIAFRGSMAVKEKHKKRSNPAAYLPKTLHLNLSRPADDAEGDPGFDFRFLTAEQATAEKDFYFSLPEVLKLKNSGPAAQQVLKPRGLADQDFPFETLDRLYQLVHSQQTINYYLEEKQNLDHVLNIFIRVNSGATKLSYSDLLMSIAAAQWSDKDAREMVHGLVDELNSIGDGYSFSKDFVLKAGLMLSDIASVGFKVTNFNAANMGKLKGQWQAVRYSLLRAVRLVADFGLADDALSADSALLPIAYHLHQHSDANGLLVKSKYEDERNAIRFFLIRSLLKGGIWGSGLDVTLTALRETLRHHKGQPFPAVELEHTLARGSRSLRFDAEGIDDLLEIGYGDRRALPLLSLLFPHVDLRHKIHVDHIYPRSLLTESRLRKEGVGAENAADWAAKRDLLPNLQLLDGSANQEKSKHLPAGWLAMHLNQKDARRNYIDVHLLDTLPERLSDFGEFFTARREQLHERLVKLLVVTAGSSELPDE